VQSLTPHQHTQLGWSVTSIADVVRALRAKGVEFEGGAGGESALFPRLLGNVLRFKGKSA
jgi:hypothetical protein